MGNPHADQCTSEPAARIRPLSFNNIFIELKRAARKGRSFSSSKKKGDPTGRFSLYSYVPAGLPRGEGLEMSIIAIRSFSSYQQ